MKVTGAILREVGKPWQLEEFELGDPVEDEVQVKLVSSGLCHSDHHLRTGDSPVPLPVIGGHEGAGVVTKVGPGVTRLKEGDHVVTAFIPACGVCEPCSRGLQNICDEGARLMSGLAISDNTNRLTTHDGLPLTQMCLLGTFAEYITVNQASLVKIEDDIPLKEAALLGCGVATGWGSAAQIGGTRTGDTVVVVGVGGVGINSVQGAVASGARFVVAVDPVPFKREMAQKMGATHTFASMEEALGPVGEFTWGKMANTTIITVGVIEGEMIAPALALTAKGGQVVVTGMGPASDIDVKLSLFELTLLQKRVQGAIFGGAGPRTQIPNLLNEYRAGKLNLADLVTTRYTLDQVNEAYDDMLNGKNIRGMIEF
ncbi:NDMA-dependent alcohol dehydrogenase [Gordonia sp. (in: high G+C Gram-positive bacteria)]|jgi:S-(hydroxymethyl)glutathione dehydrogenase/alcohol dehydrogenase|uniref:NDMA-dependent alcohol dehydrogenase n=1 Tax=Gordonia sp. (in: high G+C Gram-positive bacteria) TaxID=84139 RepID=UPI001DBB0B86|nr:NDMA-dependent alcohol dehydrogenase [Gordonia sp. (in: high G+C Gram-positive bacteria)]MCB1296552.1 NDMA-dependent alcohol dehydrogenase [Gordonia sp. (in: high G+C Gram-positive bacteria)]HMS77023.1 NDMA-dependent alcohol dehydrogenase [Gordonia sp. (in: high G+C Gram-positive bacteria)]HQV19168.1 NDMA-dependent alcohol dehydrogenase [Gordonia sp. (in: high G+C Gram-positive bacteria)]